MFGSEDFDIFSKKSRRKRSSTRAGSTILGTPRTPRNPPNEDEADPRAPENLPDEILDAEEVDFPLLEKYLLSVMKTNKISTSVARIVKEVVEVKQSIEDSKRNDLELTEEEIQANFEFLDTCDLVSRRTRGNPGESF